jgi:hypothetical protein
MKKEKEVVINRVHLTILYVFHNIDTLYKGMCINTSGWDMTEKGKKVLGNFVPTEKEIEDVVKLMIEEGTITPIVFH